MTDSDIKFPEVTVTLTGGDGNAAFLIGRVSRALRRAKVPPAEVEQFVAEATSGDYNHVLNTCMRWVDVE